ncbi:MAG: hypothetical protein OSB09_08315 [Planctomycetota bacterium]|nr:hypothetical protein [Planctomycetota bacterium]
MIQDPRPTPNMHLPADPAQASQPLRFESGSRTVWIVPSEVELVRDCGFLGAIATQHPEDYRNGRERHPVYRGTDGSLLLWKRCLRGGWLSHFISTRHFGCARFLREMEMSEQTRVLGIATSNVLAVASTSAGIGQRVEMLIRLERDVQTLKQYLEDPIQSDSQRRAVLEATADTIRVFHQAGFLHGDLNLMNILIQQQNGESPRAILVDLDPGGLGPLSDRHSNLTRLIRSYRKSILLNTPPLRLGEGIRFIHRVTGSDRDRMKSLITASQRCLPRSQWSR